MAERNNKLMSNLFKKAIVFSDIHFGRRNNDKQHNDDCAAFIDFVIDTIKEENADTLIFTGDWHDNRNTIQVSTLNYTVKCLKKLNEVGIPFYFIPGNHDLFYKEKRDVTSVIMAEEYSNITLIDEILHKEQVTFFPWIIKDDWKKVRKLAKKSEYIFGHFEVPTFLMNASSEMPNHNQIQIEDFNDVGEWAFSGHFHKRQAKGKVCYLGNTFPFDFNDNWDDDRGVMILEWKKEPVFKKWPKAPKFRTLNLSDLLEDLDSYIDDLTTIKVTQDIELNYEEMILIKDVIQYHYNPRKFEFKKQQIESEEITSTVKFQSIDQIVTDSLDLIDSTTIDKNKLKKIYEELSI